MAKDDVDVDDFDGVHLMINIILMIISIIVMIRIIIIIIIMMMMMVVVVLIIGNDLFGEERGHMVLNSIVTIKILDSDSTIFEVQGMLYPLLLSSSLSYHFSSSSSSIIMIYYYRDNRNQSSTSLSITIIFIVILVTLYHHYYYPDIGIEAKKRLFQATTTAICEEWVSAIKSAIKLANTNKQNFTRRQSLAGIRSFDSYGKN
jgi:hypothetical protein